MICGPRRRNSNRKTPTAAVHVFNLTNPHPQNANHRRLLVKPAFRTRSPSAKNKQITDSSDRAQPASAAAGVSGPPDAVRAVPLPPPACPPRAPGRSRPHRSQSTGVGGGGGRSGEGARHVQSNALPALAVRLPFLLLVLDVFDGVLVEGLHGGQVGLGLCVVRALAHAVRVDEGHEDAEVLDRDLPRRGNEGGAWQGARAQGRRAPRRETQHYQGRGRDALEGGEVASASRAPSLCPATVLLTPSAGFNGICNRQ